MEPQMQQKNPRCDNPMALRVKIVAKLWRNLPFSCKNDIKKPIYEPASRIGYRVASHGDLVIDYLRFTIDYLISSLRSLWLNNARRVMEFFSERA